MREYILLNYKMQYQRSATCLYLSSKTRIYSRVASIIGVRVCLFIYLFDYVISHVRFSYSCNLHHYRLFHSIYPFFIAKCYVLLCTYLFAHLCIKIFMHSCLYLFPIYVFIYVFVYCFFLS